MSQTIAEGLAEMGQLTRARKDVQAVLEERFGTLPEMCAVGSKSLPTSLV